MQTTDELPPPRRRDLREYRSGTRRRRKGRGRLRIVAVVAGVVGVALLAVVAPPLLRGDAPGEVVAALPARLVDLGALAAHGADQAVRGAGDAIAASRSSDRRGAGPAAPSPSAMASARQGDTPVSGVTGSSSTAQPAVVATPAAGPAPAAGQTPGAATGSLPAASAPPTADVPPATPAEPAPAAPAPAAPAPAAPAPDSPSATPTATAGTADERFAARLVELTNAERAKAGLGAFATSPCATTQAAARAAVLVAQGRFEHDPLGPILAACGGSGVGENLALGYPTPEAMMAGWMASPGHRANILRGYASIGIGCVTGPSGILCSQVFLG